MEILSKSKGHWQVSLHAIQHFRGRVTYNGRTRLSNRDIERQINRAIKIAYENERFVDYTDIRYVKVVFPNRKIQGTYYLLIPMDNPEWIMTIYTRDYFENKVPVGQRGSLEDCLD